uniref:ATP synthase F0 subunit 8 n=1 Tax=Phanuelus gladstone TaxID=2059714 RepID=A0A7U0M8D4_9ARAC|nr:ATP synthase F0 subunit 8 [Phanuelus gladstone]QQX28275.1 ATP synthase F0 subunit 8 [Phanuelus gladstone]
MPQLMPLMWIYSVMMSLFIVLVLIMLYYYKDKWILLSFDKYYMNMLITYKW